MPHKREVSSVFPDVDTTNFTKVISSIKSGMLPYIQQAYARHYFARGPTIGGGGSSHDEVGTTTRSALELQADLIGRGGLRGPPMG